MGLALSVWRDIRRHGRLVLAGSFAIDGFMRHTLILALLLGTLSGCASAPSLEPSPAPRAIPAGIDPQVATAALVEANVCLFRINDCSAPALVVFSLDSDTSFLELRKLANLTYSTKSTVPSTEELKILAKPFADETYRGDAFIKVPASLGYGGNAYIAPIWIERDKIPGKLSSGMALKLNVYVVNGAPYTTRFLGVDPIVGDRAVAPNFGR